MVVYFLVTGLEGVKFLNTEHPLKNVPIFVRIIYKIIELSILVFVEHMSKGSSKLYSTVNLFLITTINFIFTIICKANDSYYQQLVFLFNVTKHNKSTSDHQAAFNLMKLYALPRFASLISFHPREFSQTCILTITQNDAMRFDPRNRSTNFEIYLLSS